MIVKISEIEKLECAAGLNFTFIAKWKSRFLKSRKLEVAGWDLSMFTAACQIERAQTRLEVDAQKFFERQAINSAQTRSRIMAQR